MIQDVTERMQVQQALVESEERYRHLFENNPHPMWVYDLETLAFLAVNDAAVHHYGYGRDEFLAMSIATSGLRKTFLRSWTISLDCRGDRCRGHLAAPEEGRHDHRRGDHLSFLEWGTGRPRSSWPRCDRAAADQAESQRLTIELEQLVASGPPNCSR